jgi:hypothetical protein
MFAVEIIVNSYWHEQEAFDKLSLEFVRSSPTGILMPVLSHHELTEERKPLKVSP